MTQTGSVGVSSGFLLVLLGEGSCLSAGEPIWEQISLVLLGLGEGCGEGRGWGKGMEWRDRAVPL